jgi:hypothetical protein
MASVEITQGRSRKGSRQGGRKIKVLGAIAGVLLVVLVAVGVRARLTRGQVKGTSGTNGGKVVTTEVGREFDFGAMNRQGEVDGTVKLRVISAEKTDEVLIKGKPARAKGEKMFLVLNLELDNQLAEIRYAMPVDLIRLRGEEGKLFAPDVHSDVVEIRPLSTKITRVGFVILGEERLFEVLVGELEGEKQSVEIKFSK